MNDKVLGAGILAFDKNTGRTLFGRRGLKGDAPNTWTPFGGTFEKKDITPRQTAIREFSEETGCKEKYLLSKKPFYVNESNQVKFYTYIGIFDGQFPVKINSENRDFEWFDLRSLPDNLHPGTYELIVNKKKELEEFVDYLTSKNCI